MFLKQFGFFKNIFEYFEFSFFVAIFEGINRRIDYYD